MTVEEFTAQADLATRPAIEWVVLAAFETVPPERVEILVGTYLEFMKNHAIEAVREIIAKSGRTN